MCAPARVQIRLVKKYVLPFFHLDSPMRAPAHVQIRLVEIYALPYFHLGPNYIYNDIMPSFIASHTVIASSFEVLSVVVIVYANS